MPAQHNSLISRAGWYGKNITISILSRFFSFPYWLRVFYKLQQIQGHSFDYKHIVGLYLVPDSSLWFMNDQIVRITCWVNVFCKLTAASAKVNKLKEIFLNSSDEFVWRCVTTANQFWHFPDITDTLKARTSRCLDVKSDMAAKTVLCVNTLLQHDFIHRRMTLWTQKISSSFPTFLGLPQLIQSRNEDYIRS